MTPTLGLCSLAAPRVEEWSPESGATLGAGGGGGFDSGDFCAPHRPRCRALPRSCRSRQEPLASQAWCLTTDSEA